MKKEGGENIVRIKKGKCLIASDSEIRRGTAYYTELAASRHRGTVNTNLV